jgi:hypothetical protein
VTTPAAVDQELVAWTTAIPSIRCSAAALAPWSGAKNTVGVPAATTAHFERASFTTFGPNAPVVARGANGYLYVLARVPAAHAVLVHAGSEADESSFSAVLTDAGAPTPRHAVATMDSAPRTSEGLGLGSTRARVEAVLGAARTHHTSCGTDVVHYVPVHPQISEASLWFVYRNGIVVAFARYEAV